MTTDRLTCLTARAVIRLAPESPGEDVAGFLQGLVTNDVVKGPLPAYAALLTPQGKVLFDFIVWPDGDGQTGSLLVDCEAQAAPALVKRLSLYRLRRRIAIIVDDRPTVHWSPVAAAAPAHAVPDPRLAALGWRWLEHGEAERHDAPATGSADGATAHEQAWRAHRLALSIVEGREELGDGEILWLEANAAELNGVSFTKGCYVGQENTARMNWRQKVNRRLLVVPQSRSNPARQRRQWPDFGLALDHMRIEDMPADLVPTWLAPALQKQSQSPACQS